MAVSLAASGIKAPSPSTLLTPILPALTAAAVSKEPAENVLPLLSPILRQRIQFLSASSSDPWLYLLCYDRSKAQALQEIATNGSLEVHPVSGEVECDWETESETRFRRVDEETLQALVVLTVFGIAFRLLWCRGENDSAGEGWKIGEITTFEAEDPFGDFVGKASIAEADGHFLERKVQKSAVHTNGQPSNTANLANDEDSDDGYWDQYDATPSQTPAPKRSPPPASMSNNQIPARELNASAKAEEDDHYAQYDIVQPAMDNHDPDEEAAALDLSPPLEPYPMASGHSYQSLFDLKPQILDEALLHPRPESSASSSKGSELISKLEDKAGRQEQGEFGVKQHVSRSIRSLYMLSRASGIEKAEFERIVRTELDLLGMMDEGEGAESS